MGDFHTIEEDKRILYGPIPQSRMHIEEYVKKAMSAFWTFEEIDFSTDIVHFSRLDDDTKVFIEHVLALFAPLDEIIIKTVEPLSVETEIPEVARFLRFQNVMEDIHSRTYHEQFELFVPDAERRKTLLSAIVSEIDIPHWIRECLAEVKAIKAVVNYLPAAKIFINACIEGILLPSAFCPIYWLQRTGKMPGLCQANELVSRDESYHVYFGAIVTQLCKTVLTQEMMESMVKGMVKIATKFINKALPHALIEMNAELMGVYIKYIADNLLILYGAKPIYSVKNPFPFMEQINMKNKENFFEKKSTSYVRPPKPTSVFSSEW